MPQSTPTTLVLTRCWAFYLADGRCLAARDRQSGTMVPFHEAVGGELLGSLRRGTPQPHRAAFGGGPRVGELLCVRGRRGLFCSEEILSIERCPRPSAAPPAATAHPHRPAGAPRPTRPGPWQRGWHALVSALATPA